MTDPAPYRNGLVTLDREVVLDSLTVQGRLPSWL